MNRVWDAIAWLVVGAIELWDRRKCDWANKSHLPMDGE